MIGEGKYDDAATVAREQTGARGLLLIVIGGKHGNGFSCQADLDTLVRVPELLEDVAQKIRDDIKRAAQ